MDPKTIQTLLHASTLKTHYLARAGELVEIPLPRVPMSRHTEFLRIKREISGGCLEEQTSPSVEGTVLPRSLLARATQPGCGQIRLTAFDALSNSPVPGVDPLDIRVDISSAT